VTTHVSTIIPVYNGELYLAEALESVLAQTHAVSEIIVVDDGSTDRSGEIARSFGVRYLRKTNAGQASALNAGITAAKSDLLAFLDADDRWLPNKLALQLEALALRPELEIVFGHARQFIEHRVGLADDGEKRVLPSRLPSAMLLRRAAWERIGPFSDAWALGAVIEWCARAADSGVPVVMLDAVLYERRIHGKNSSLTHRAPAREYARMLKDLLDRRKDGTS
jgi:glycosyltransferase involved in cell wall biosynthesis